MNHLFMITDLRVFLENEQTMYLPSSIYLLYFVSANASNAGWFVMMFTRLLGCCTGAQRLIPCLVTISWGTRKFQGTNVFVTKEIYSNVHDFVQEVSLKLSPNMTNLRSASGGGQMCLIWQRRDINVQDLLTKVLVWEVFFTSAPFHSW
jgi:hypothetical protein